MKGPVFSTQMATCVATEFVVGKPSLYPGTPSPIPRSHFWAIPLAVPILFGLRMSVPMKKVGVGVLVRVSTPESMAGKPRTPLSCG